MRDPFLPIQQFPPAVRRYVITFRSRVYDQNARNERGTQGAFPSRTVVVEAYDAKDAVVFAEAKAFGGGEGGAPTRAEHRAEYVLADARLARDDEP